MAIKGLEVAISVIVTRPSSRKGVAYVCVIYILKAVSWIEDDDNSVYRK